MMMHEEEKEMDMGASAGCTVRGNAYRLGARLVGLGLRLGTGLGLRMGLGLRGAFAQNTLIEGPAVAR